MQRLRRQKRGVYRGGEEQSNNEQRTTKYGDGLRAETRRDGRNNHEGIPFPTKRREEREKKVKKKKRNRKRYVSFWVRIFFRESLLNSAHGYPATHNTAKWYLRGIRWGPCPSSIQWNTPKSAFRLAGWGNGPLHGPMTTASFGPPPSPPRLSVLSCLDLSCSLPCTDI